MKNIYQILFFSLFAVNAFAQQATEIDSKFVKLPRYANFAAITTALVSPTQGMMVYNIDTKSNWTYNGSAWTNNIGAVSAPLYLTSTTTTITGETNQADESGILGINTTDGVSYGVIGKAFNNAPEENGAGVWGDNKSTNNLGFGIKGTHDGTGWAGYFEGTNALKANGKTELLGDVNVTGAIQTNGNSGNNGQILQNNGNGTMSWQNSIASLNTLYPNSRSYRGLFDNIANSVSTFTFTVPAGITKVWVEGWGGGSAGTILPATITNTTSARGGKSGNFLSAVLNVTPGEILDLQVGNGNTLSTGGISKVIRTSLSQSIFEVGSPPLSYFLENSNNFLSFVQGAYGHIPIESYSQTSSTNYVRTISGGHGGSSFPSQNGGRGVTVTYNLSTNTVLSYFSIDPEGSRDVIPGGGGGVGYLTQGAGAPGMLVLHW